MSPINGYLSPEERLRLRAEAQKKARKRRWIDRFLVGGAVSGLLILALVLSIGRLVLAGFMIYWNVTDIVSVGPNFWNIFWLVIAAVLIFAPSGSRS